MKLWVIAEIPDDKAQAFLQAVRDFDVANAGCKFEIAGKSDLSLADVVEMLKVNPELTLRIIKR